MRFLVGDGSGKEYYDGKSYLAEVLNSFESYEDLRGERSDEKYVYGLNVDEGLNTSNFPLTGDNLINGLLIGACTILDIFIGYSFSCAFSLIVAGFLGNYKGGFFSA